MSEQKADMIIASLQVLHHDLSIMPALTRPAHTFVGQIPPPVVYRATQFSVTTAAAGATANLLAGLTNRIREIAGGYVRQTAGANRNFQLEINDGTNTRAVSDNDSGSKSLRGIINLRNGDTLRINGASAADDATYQGWLFHKDIGFEPL